MPTTELTNLNERLCSSLLITPSSSSIFPQEGTFTRSSIQEQRGSITRKYDSFCQTTSHKGQYDSFEQTQCNSINTKKKSFMELQKNKKHIYSKLLRTSVCDLEQIIEEEDEMIVCQSDLYAYKDGIWINRAIKNLTTKKVAGISVETITKIKIKAQQPMAGYYILRLTGKNNKVDEFAIRSSCLGSWFALSAWVCLVNAGNEIKMEFEEPVQCQKQGTLLKLSDILRKWEPHYIKIDEKGLHSSKEKGLSETLKITKTSQIWTRLETIQHSKFLVIKLWNKFVKEQFAIPIKHTVSWMRAFSTLILSKQSKKN